MNTASQINFQRVKQELQSRFNPLRNLTPQTLATQLDDFARGYFYRVGQTFDIIERRDDTLRTVASKRKRSVGRHGWEIIPVEEGAAADRQVEVLEDFYNNITVSHALKQDMRGGWGALCEQMLDAVGKGYAAHELLWQPARGGKGLSCTFNFVPVWFFEATEGKLRYLESAGQTRGTDLIDDAWMVTCGDGLMEAAAVNYMFKRLPMQDWLGYSEKYGFPWPHMETTAAYGTDEWNAAVDALANFMNDGSIVTSTGQKINLVESQGKGPDVFEKLIERMDRAMAMLWRGSDLSTMSAGDSVGASVQGEETELIEADDALLIEDTLNAYVSRFVVRYTFGAKAEQLAYIKVKTGGRTDDKEDLAKWKLGAELGVELSAADFRERFGLPTPEDGDDLVKAPNKQATPGAPGVAEPEAANAETDPETLAQIADALRADFAEVLPLLDAIEAADTPEDYADAIAALESALRTKQIDPAKSALAKTLEAALGTAAVEGALDAPLKTALQKTES